MITNNDVNDFIGNLSQHLQVLIARIGNQETWSSDNEDDVNSLINQLSESLEKTHPETLSKASHLLLTNSAYFTLPRFLKFITFIAEKNPRAVNQMLSPLNKEKVSDGEVYLNTVLSRLRYLIQSILVSEIFSPETMKRVQLAVLEHERIKNSPDTVSEKNHEPDVDNLDIEGFDDDAPFAIEETVNEEETVAGQPETVTDQTLQIDEEINNQGVEIETQEPNQEIRSESPEAKNNTDNSIAGNNLKSEKHAPDKSNYQFKKKAVLDLLNQMKDEANQSD